LCRFTEVSFTPPLACKTIRGFRRYMMRLPVAQKGNRFNLLPHNIFLNI